MIHAAASSSALWLMLLLGAFHGLNPGMGWLFAVALGMQERRGSAVARALVPIGVGHFLAVAGMALAAVFLGLALPRDTIRYFAAAALLGLGLYALLGHRHPRWVRMQVGFRDLTLWSFLMASAHGAGLMVLPVLLGSSTVEAADRMSSHHAASVTPLSALLATGVHTAAYLGVMGAVAWTIYTRFGLAILRKAWLNLNLVWAVALIATGLATVLM